MSVTPLCDSCEVKGGVFDRGYGMQDIEQMTWQTKHGTDDMGYLILDFCEVQAHI